MLPMLLTLPTLTAAMSAGGAAAAGAGASGGMGALTSMLPSLSGLIGGGGSSEGGSSGMSSLLGKLNPGAGAAFGLGSSIIQGLQANKAKNQANSLQPALYDPMQLAMLDEIQQRRQSLLTGSAFAGQAAGIDQAQAGVNRAIVSSSGGDVSAALQGLLASQSNAGRAKNELYAGADSQMQFYSNLGTNLMNRISDRALQLELAQQGQNRAVWAQKSQDAYANAANAASRMDPSMLLDLLQRDKNASRNDANQSSSLTPMQEARMQEPIQNILSPDSGVEDVGDPLLNAIGGFQNVGLGDTAGIPVF